MINSSSVGRQDSTSEILELEAISPNGGDSIDRTESDLDLRSEERRVGKEC